MRAGSSASVSVPQSTGVDIFAWDEDDVEGFDFDLDGAKGECQGRTQGRLICDLPIGGFLVFRGTSPSPFPSVRIQMRIRGWA